MHLFGVVTHAVVFVAVLFWQAGRHVNNPKKLKPGKQTTEPMPNQTQLAKHPRMPDATSTRTRRN